MSLSHDRPKRVGILFAGGPAPAANAVISTAAVSCLNRGIEVYGIRHGYSRLMEYSKDRPLVRGKDYIAIDDATLRRARNSQGIMLGTARSNPGKDINSRADLANEELATPLKTVYHALGSLGIDALISIGGDDTLKTANKLKLFQDQFSEADRIPIVHLPKTIDNDYMGIDFTFGYFTAVEFLASEIRNLLFDAEASSAYFLTETMGRSAGWLAYGAAIAGEASLVLSVEDIHGELETTETYEQDDVTQVRRVMNVKNVIGRLVDTMIHRDGEGKEFGVFVIAEGLAELLPLKYLKGVSRDEHLHISISEVNLGRLFSKLITDEYSERTKRKRKVTGLQLGYESRCAIPHAFDVMLGSQLGVGAYRALFEEKLNGVMVSVTGQLDLHYVPFEELVDPATLVTKVRYIERNSDFYVLARFLETSLNK
jgi:ATP-dependent phosphofructokinase / diphosphate-dependent phosphofructokinase